MEKEFIPYALSLALKELGFDEECLGWYVSKTSQTLEIELVKQENLLRDAIIAPLYQQAFRWFREKDNLHQVVLADEKGKYDIIVGERISGSCLGQYETYEEAELECLKKLIEIVKTK